MFYVWSGYGCDSSDITPYLFSILIIPGSLGEISFQAVRCGGIVHLALDLLAICSPDIWKMTDVEIKNITVNWTKISYAIVMF